MEPDRIAVTSSRIAKHLPRGEPRETLKGITKDILREAEIEEPAASEGDDMVSVRIPWSLYERWKALA